jgi:hypothetical protein
VHELVTIVLNFDLMLGKTCDMFKENLIVNINTYFYYLVSNDLFLGLIAVLVTLFSTFCNFGPSILIFDSFGPRIFKTSDMLVFFHHRIIYHIV